MSTSPIKTTLNQLEITNIINSLPTSDKDTILSYLDMGYDAVEFANEVLNDTDKLSDSIHEFADSQPSVYTADRYQWAYDNIHLMQTYEEEALSLTIKNVESVIAYCWYKDAYNTLTEAINKLRNLLEDAQLDQDKINVDDIPL